MPPTTATRLDCPRCGYDIGEQAARARAAGVDEGTCSECGLAVCFSQLDEAVIGPRWFVESSLGRRRLVRRAFATVARCVWPHRFWSAIPLGLRISPAGIALFLLPLAALLHAIAAFARCSEIWFRYALPGGIAGQPMREAMSAMAYAAFSPLSCYDGGMIMRYAVVASPRNASDGQAILVVVGKALQHGFNPFSDGMVFATSPQSAFRGAPLRLDGELVPLLSEPALATAIPTALGAVLAPLVLLLLPTSLRRARIRPRHFVRCVAYSLALLAPILAIALFLPWIGASYRATLGLALASPYGLLNAHVVLLVASSVLVLVWMHAISSRYLRLPHALGVAASATAVAMLLAALAAAVLLPLVQ